MTGRHSTTKTGSSDKDHQRRIDPRADAVSEHAQAGMLPTPTVGLAAGLSGVLQTAQRQAQAARIGTLQGNRQLQRMVASPGLAPAAIQRDLLDTAADALDIRENEAELDEWEDYQEALEDLRVFRSSAHVTEDFQSTTRIGVFDVIYSPSSGTLGIIVRCRFNFVNGSAAEFPKASAKDLAWTDEAAKEDWKARFLTTVNAAWSGKHVFYCHKDWWEGITAEVKTDFHETSSDPHFELTIAKIPTGAFRTSSVRSPTVVPLLGMVESGRGSFDSEDLKTVAKPGGMQTPAVHEAGHMLDLDDEYVSPGPVAHSDLVKSEFGQGVAKGTDGRVMSGGNDIQPEHGVTFLAALKKATDMTEWTATMCPIPRPIPKNPQAFKDMGDYSPLPSGETRAV